MLQASSPSYGEQHDEAAEVPDRHQCFAGILALTADTRGDLERYGQLHGARCLLKGKAIADGCLQGLLVSSATPNAGPLVPVRNQHSRHQ